MTHIADEITKLDNGTFVGWARTGKSFKVYRDRRGRVERGVPLLQHGVRPEELALLHAQRAGVRRGQGEPELDVRGRGVPRPVSGRSTATCPADTVPVYRMYNDGQGGAPNHRYTTDLAVRSAMLALGWIPEGMGKIGVIMCAPQ